VKPIDPVKKLFMKHATEDGHIFAKELKHFLRELSGTGMYSTHIKVDKHNPNLKFNLLPL
jgi:hypothetical protein